MKSLIKLAIGAAVAGALVNMLMKQQGERRMARSRGERFTDVGPDSSYDEHTDATTARGSDELIPDTNMVGDPANQQGGQPQDWRGAQNVTGP